MSFGVIRAAVICVQGVAVGLVFARDIIAFGSVFVCAFFGKRGSLMPNVLVITHSIASSKDLVFNSPIRLNTFDIEFSRLYNDRQPGLLCASGQFKGVKNAPYKWRFTYLLTYGWNKL